jgi:CubicO group peptidase (beta-lactamase class C family)
MKLVNTLIIALLLAASVAAQEPKRVIVRAGRDNAELTKDWPKLAAKPGASDKEIASTLNGYLDALAKRDLFSGTIVVARKNNPIYSKSAGYANREHSVPNAIDTKFNIGSINKIFTTVALAQLRDAGKIDFDATLRTYLPDYPNALADKITIRQLINHNSGMGDFFGPKYMAAPKDEIRTLADYLPFFADKPLEFEPGARNRYSNAGFIVLGLVIEKISGTSYYEYIRDNIYKRAGMNDSDSYQLDEIVPKRATGYTKRGPDGDLPSRVSNIYALPARGSSAGGGYSTAGDLLKFVRALREGKLLSAESSNRIIGGGAGWAGGTPGVNALVETSDEWDVIVLSNYDPPAAEEAGRNIRTLLGMAGD